MEESKAGFNIGLSAPVSSSLTESEYIRCGVPLTLFDAKLPLEEVMGRIARSRSVVKCSLMLRVTPFVTCRGKLAVLFCQNCS